MSGGDSGFPYYFLKASNLLRCRTAERAGRKTNPGRCGESSINYEIVSYGCASLTNLNARYNEIMENSV
jgi:hypothetical protein